MKITKSKLIEIIKEEIAKHVEENYRDAADDTIADTVPHSWLNHGKLSSTLQERYGISEEDSVGTVVWHSLNENGEIGVYDMRFGDTIIRNLTEADLTEKVMKEKHGKRDAHGERDESDPERKRRYKKWNLQEKS